MTIALTGGRLIDGNGGNPVPDTNIIIEGEKITQIGPAAKTPVPKDAQVINVAGKTVMPGLIDGHIHIVGEFAPDPMDPFTNLPSYAPLRGVAASRRLLDAGFTACRAMNDADYAGIALKHAIEHGLLPGPRMLAAGYNLKIVGNLREWVPPNQYSLTPANINGPWEVRRAIRVNLLNGADFIELQIAGAVGSNSPTPFETTEWTQEELDAAVDEAHSRGMSISADCYVDESVEMCAKAGFDGIEHGCLITERGLETLLKHDMYICPTLCAYYAYLGPEGEKRYPPWRVVKGRRVEETLRKTWPKYAEMGVKVVGGSDGCGPGIGRRPGDGALELQLMVDYGMTPMQAIVCNTKNVADAMRMSDQIGTLEAGKFADLIVVDGDPLADIKILQDRKKLQLVMKGGDVFRSDL